MSESNTVSSEIYAEGDFISDKKPKINGNVVSIFKFCIPDVPKLDADGDFELQRRPKNKDKDYTEIEIEHSTNTSLNLVGLQIWRGALLLADWLICNSKKFEDESKILELGSGVGLTSIVASMFKSVLCTDINEGGILDLLQNNIDRNKALVKNPISVLELNFFKNDFNPELLKLLLDVKIILAADVIYDNDITVAFVKTMQALLKLCPKSSIYVALEKRFVFLLSECDTYAPCYEFFLECVQQCPDIVSEQLLVDFPQYFL
ncbi:methyltransferase-related [Holotrichia oblita]|uniref:Methyltransferase-related n=1 Tax=Holotrichia oblita TaxID=644536 RepID=A0ACB9TY49_HOLOL|nr:methyltransferase-related [Holotrichia oblita]